MSVRPAQHPVRPERLRRPYAGNSAATALIASEQHRSVPRVLRQTAPPGQTSAASTRDGVTRFASNLGSSSRAAEVRAHEAVHRAQFAAAGQRSFGDRRQLEADAQAGAAELLRGRSYMPRYAAPRGLLLNYEPPAWMPDTVAVNQRELDAAARVQPGPDDKPRVRILEIEKEEGTLRSQEFQLISEAVGARGRIYSETHIGIVKDTGNPMVSVSSASRDPLQEIGPPVDVPAYPIRIVYNRSIQFRDDKGRTCTVEMAGNVHFTEEQWEQQVAAGAADFEGLLRMVGNVGVVGVQLDGQSPIDGFAYHMRLSVSAQSVREQLEQASALPNLMAGLGTTLTSSERADFLLIDAPAGAQFDALQAFLFSADQHEIDRRMAELMAQLRALLRQEDESDSWLDRLASWLGDKVSRAWNALPAPVRGILKAVGKAGLAIAAVIGAAALVVALSPIELAAGTVALVIGGALLLGSFVSSLFRRSDEAKATGKGGTVGHHRRSPRRCHGSQRRLPSYHRRIDPLRHTAESQRRRALGGWSPRRHPGGRDGRRNASRLQAR